MQHFLTCLVVHEKGKLVLSLKHNNWKKLFPFKKQNTVKMTQLDEKVRMSNEFVLLWISSLRPHNNKFEQQHQSFAFYSFFIEYPSARWRSSTLSAERAEAAADATHVLREGI